MDGKTACVFAFCFLTAAFFLSCASGSGPSPRDVTRVWRTCLTECVDLEVTDVRVGEFDKQKDYWPVRFNYKCTLRSGRIIENRCGFEIEITKNDFGEWDLHRRRSWLPRPQEWLDEAEPG